VSKKKKRLKRFFVISSIKIGQFWWNLVHRLPNIFASKWCKRFPLHLNNVSTLPCETWNAHCTHAAAELLQKETPEFISPQLWPPHLPYLNPVDKQYMGYVAREGVQNTHHCSGAVNDATDEWLLQWQHSLALGLIGPLCSQSLFEFVQISDTFCTTSRAIVLTQCNQLDSNLANLEATVEVG